LAAPQVSPHHVGDAGAGLGPLAGKVFRIGLMGTSSSQELVDLLSGALENALKSMVQALH
jgi:alanine-glyoxylate transaminase/serine-glyoxylate transaminase/serine-pyruvate transaminase